MYDFHLDRLNLSRSGLASNPDSTTVSWASAVDLLQREGLQSPRIARTVDVWFEGIRSPAGGGNSENEYE